LAKSGFLPDITEQIVETCLRRMAQIRATGGATNETSFYGALENLLNTAGAGINRPAEAHL
jgi:pantothenate kinase